MAVPKKRTGHSAQGHRRSKWKATKPETTKCSNCGTLSLTHTVCTECGYYKGQPVRLKDKAEMAAVEEKKPTKKASPKAKKAEKAEKVEETKMAKKETKPEAKVEEVKIEASEKEAQVTNKTETSETIEETEK